MENVSVSIGKFDLSVGTSGYRVCFVVVLVCENETVGNQITT